MYNDGKGILINSKLCRQMKIRWGRIRENGGQGNITVLTFRDILTVQQTGVSVNVIL